MKKQLFATLVAFNIYAYSDCPFLNRLNQADQEEAKAFLAKNDAFSICLKTDSEEKCFKAALESLRRSKALETDENNPLVNQEAPAQAPAEKVEEKAPEAEVAKTDAPAANTEVAAEQN
jgi:hypothetical protein